MPSLSQNQIRNGGFCNSGEGVSEGSWSVLALFAARGSMQSAAVPAGIVETLTAHGFIEPVGKFHRITSDGRTALKNWRRGARS